MVKHVQEEQYCLYCDELRLCDVRYSEEKDKEDMFTCLTCGTLKIGMFTWLPPVI